ncbi:CoA pyrophosphatase [Psychromonas hadalis]|uniref:CoA pyrophosphatase n=1 Tax=Psychromonas hadalis TaxID=211669 RepID=UPI0003B68D6D|nr:CoA pyrophosphatase [Psychromonas hadalis]
MNRESFLNFFLFSSPKKQRSLDQNLKKAAVLIILVERRDGLHIILTERALHLRHHPGQVSFPGGKYEPRDLTLQQTARRETEEEIGIDAKFINMIGELPALNTTSGFEVFPFIAFVDSQFILKIDAQEVKSVFEVPLSFLLENKNFYRQHLVANKKRHFTYCISYQNHLIWGATAQILKNLQQLLQKD